MSLFVANATVCVDVGVVVHEREPLCESKLLQKGKGSRIVKKLQHEFVNVMRKSKREAVKEEEKGNCQIERKNARNHYFH